jgi:hypothetical protein
MARLVRDLTESGREHVPTQVMLDYAYGGLDDDLLTALYGSHLSRCPGCSRGVEIYRRQRPKDPARVHEVPEFSHVVPADATYRLTPEEAGGRLRSFILESSGPLLIVAGEANPAVYNRALGDALRERAWSARRAGDPIPQVICGPAMGLDEEIKTPSETLLPALAEEGAIQLYASRSRQPLHFRVSGQGSVYTEEYHEAGNPADRHGYRYRSRPIADLFRRRFQAILDAGLARPAGRSGFVYLSMDTIRRLQSRLPQGFDALTAEDLKRYAA